MLRGKHLMIRQNLDLRIRGVEPEVPTTTWACTCAKNDGGEYGTYSDCTILAYACAAPTLTNS